MERINETTLGLTSTEAYCLLAPTEFGYSNYLMQDGVFMECRKKEGGELETIEEEEAVGGWPSSDWCDFQISFDSEFILEEELPVIEGLLKDAGIIKEPKKTFVQRYSDIRQECLEMINNIPITSNEYGMPRPAFLDMSESGILLDIDNMVLGVKGTFRVIGIFFGGWIIFEAAEGVWRILNQYNLTCEKLAILCDEIEEKKFSSDNLYKVDPFRCLSEETIVAHVKEVMEWHKSQKNK